MISHLSTGLSELFLVSPLDANQSPCQYAAMKATKAAVVRYFGNKNRTAKALGLSRQAVQNWPRGPIPELYQFRLRERFPEFYSSISPQAD